MSQLGERLQAYWNAQDIPKAPGVGEDRLREFEIRFGVTLPPDLRDYFLKVDGMGTYEGFDDDLFVFWPFDRVCRVSDDYADEFMEEQESYFLFADHSIYLPAFAIRLAPLAALPNTVVAIIGDRREYHTSIVARSFTEFVERYLGNETSRYDLSIGFDRNSDDEQ